MAISKHFEQTDNFASMSLRELMAVRDTLNQLISQKAGEERAALMAKLAELDGLTNPAAPTKNRSRQSPKTTHVGPNGETWSSRGSKPKWLKDLIALGHSESEFLVKD